MVAELPSDAVVRSWAEGLSDGALLCRTNPSNHQPVPTTVDMEQLEGSRRWVYVQNYRCRNLCGCEWNQIVDAVTGMQYRLRIKYPSQGYLAPRGFGRIVGHQKDIVRLIAFQRRITRREAS